MNEWCGEQMEKWLCIVYGIEVVIVKAVATAGIVSFLKRA